MGDFDRRSQLEAGDLTELRASDFLLAMRDERLDGGKALKEMIYFQAQLQRIICFLSSEFIQRGVVLCVASINPVDFVCTQSLCMYVCLCLASKSANLSPLSVS